MWDASTSLFRIGKDLPRAAMAAALLAIACGLGGCAGGAAVGGSFAMANSGSAPTVAFESIDGPPPHLFDRMVGVLDSEAKLRNLRSSRARARRPTGCEAISRPRSAADAPPSPGSLTSMTRTSSGRCAFPARKRPARPGATPGLRLTISCCGKSPKPD